MSASHQAIVETFYQAFDRRDWQTMNSLYHQDVTFYDPVFGNLNARETTAMWQMLLERAQDLRVKHFDISCDEEYGQCKWIATYTFSPTGRKVENHVKSHFKFYEGKIAEHMDDFDLWRWSRQALGTSGLVLGWSPMIRKKIRQQARKNLDKFLASRGQP